TNDRILLRRPRTIGDNGTNGRCSCDSWPREREAASPLPLATALTSRIRVIGALALRRERVRQRTLRSSDPGPRCSPASWSATLLAWPARVGGGVGGAEMTTHARAPAVQSNIRPPCQSHRRHSTFHRSPELQVEATRGGKRRE